MPVSANDTKDPLWILSKPEGNADPLGILQKKSPVANGSKNGSQNAGVNSQPSSLSELPSQSAQPKGLTNDDLRNLIIPSSTNKWGTPLPPSPPTPEEQWQKKHNDMQREQAVQNAVITNAKQRLNAQGKLPTQQNLNDEIRSTNNDLQEGKLITNHDENGNVSIQTKAGFMEGVTNNVSNFLNNINYAPSLIYAKAKGDNKKLSEIGEQMSRDKEYINNHPYSSLGDLLSPATSLAFDAASNTAHDEGEDRLSYKGTSARLGQSIAGIGTTLAPLAIPVGGEALEGVDAATSTLASKIAQNYPRMLAGAAQTYVNNVPENFNALYQQNKQDFINQGMNEDDAKLASAHKSSTDAMVQGILPSVAQGVFFSGGLDGGIAANSFGDALMGALKNSAKFSAINTAQAGAEDIIKNWQGYKTNTLDDMGEAAKSGFLQTMAMELLPHALSLPSNLQNQLYNYASKNIAEPLLKTHLDNVPDGAKIADNITTFKDALDKIPQDLPEDKKVEIAPLIKQKQALTEEMNSKDNSFKEAYQQKIAAVDDQIKQVVLRPTSEEVADIRSQQLSSKMNPPKEPDYIISRHSDTVKDEQSKVSGTDQNPLSEGGRKDAVSLANDVQKHAAETGVPITKVVSSDLERAKETAQTVADKTGAQAAHDKNLRTWDIGEFNDTKDSDFKKVQKWFVGHPDDTVYKPDIETKEGEKPQDKDADYGKKINESFNDYAKRTIEAHQKYEGEPASTMIIDHSNNMMVMDAYRKNGNTWDEKAAQDYLKSEKPEPATLQNKPPNAANIPAPSIENPELRSQALSTPNSISKQIGEAKTVDLISSHTPEEIEGSIKQIQKYVTDGSLTAEEGDAHIKLLEKGLDKSNETNTENNTENKQSNQQTKTQSQPNEPVGEDKPTAEEGKGKVTGISHKSLTAIAERLGLNDPERGTYLPIEQQDERGRQLLAGGADPDRIIQDFKNDGKVSADGISVVKARAAELQNAVDEALDKYGRKSNEFDIAKKQLQDFNVDAKKMGTGAGEALNSLRDSDGVNVTSQTAMEEAVRDETGNNPTPKQTEKISQLVAKNKALADKNAELENRLTETIDKAVKEDKVAKEKAPKKDYAKERTDAFAAARMALKKLRTGESGLGVGVPFARELAAIAPHVAKIVKSLIEEGVDKLGDIVDRLHDEFKDDIKGLRRRDIMDVIAGDYDKKSDLIKNPDEEKLSDIKRQARLTKKLQDLQNDLPENFDKNKKEQSAEVTKLLAQIKKVKDDLAEYKNPKVEEAKLTPEQKQQQKFKDLSTRFTDKKDSKFSPTDVKDIWEYAKKNYLDKKKGYGEMISGVSTDLGLTSKQVREAIASPKGAKRITDELYANRARQNAAISEAKDYVRKSKSSPLIKALKATSNFFFNKAIFGHGTVGFGTHGGQNLFIPTTWKHFFPGFIDQFKNSFGGLTDKGLAKYEMRMEDLRNSPNFILAKRAGLANDPRISYDEYTGLNKYIANKLGDKVTAKINNFSSKLNEKLPNVKGMGDRGFNTIKQLRQDMFDTEYNKLSDVEKSDPETAKNIADVINHATGTSNPIFASGSNAEAGANAVLFAPKLQASKFARLITQPIKAIDTLAHWKDATPAEKASAKLVGTRTGQFLATYLLALSANQGILAATGSKNKVNFTDPTQKDFLKFKVWDKTIDFSGGMIPAIQFLSGLGAIAFESSKELKREKRGDKFQRVLGNFASNMLSPIAGTVKDVVTQHDFSGNTLPFSNDKPLYKDSKKLTWGQYITQTQLPIPVSDAFKTMSDKMAQNGVPQSQINIVLGGLLHAALTGLTGVKINEDFKKKK